jgi:hypothetical protein
MEKDYKLEYKHFVHRSMYADQCFDDAVTYIKALNDEEARVKAKQYLESIGDSGGYLIDMSTDGNIAMVV